MGFYSRTLKDYDGEESNVQVHVADLSEANISAQITAQATFGSGINGITTGSLQRIRYGNLVESNQPAPANTWAQRELKWRVDYVDNVSGKPYHFTVPCADTSLLDPNNKGKMDIHTALYAGEVFVTNTEAYVLSPEGNSITVQQVVLVGRNL